MKYRIKEIKFKDKTVYEPQVCKQVKTKTPTGEWEIVDTWDDIIIDKGLVHQKIYLDLLPKTAEEAKKIIETYHYQNLILTTLKNFNNPKNPSSRQ